MAITEIHAIESTPNLALAYVINDKVEEYNSGTEISTEIRHTVFEENGKKCVLFSTLNAYHNCNVDEPMSSYEKRAAYGRGRLRKEAPRTKSGKEIVMWHLVQSFSEKISPIVANEIGQKLAAEVFGNFTVTISTHTNTDNIHNHLMISAWDMDGRKWHDCHATKRQIRAVSDRLCAEYGLSVLENTRDMKLVQYKDKDGTTRYFEPTDRKVWIIRQRDEQKTAPDSVHSYRHTPQYQKEQAKVVSNREQIKHDIDMLLPSVNTYEDLLGHLREMGYHIRDRKKDGSPLAHVSFQAPQHDKGVRDSSLGEFYFREQLSTYIEQQIQRNEYEKANHRDNAPKMPTNVPYFANYDYGSLDMSHISDTHRTVKTDDGSIRVIERMATEKKLLSHIRIKDSEVKGLIDTTGLQRIIEEQKQSKTIGITYMSKNREERLVAQIQSSFQCLRYVEQYHIYSYKQIYDLYAAYKGKYDRTIENFTKAETAIKALQEVLQVPDKIAALEAKIDSKRMDIGYILEEHGGDKKKLEQYKAILQKHKIDTPDKAAVFREKVQGFKAKHEQNCGHRENVLVQMAELENCMRTFERMDRESGKGENAMVRDFEKMSGFSISPTYAVPEPEKKKHRQMHDTR